MTNASVSPTTPAEFEAPSPADRIERVAEALERHNIEAIVVATGPEARDRVLAMVPLGAEVLYEEPRPGRVTVVLVGEPVGV